MNHSANPISSATPTPEPITRGDVERWRAEADAFFVGIRRELSCLTGESTEKKRSSTIETPAVDPSVGVMETRESQAPSEPTQPPSIAAAAPTEPPPSPLGNSSDDEDRLALLKRQIAEKLAQQSDSSAADTNHSIQ